MDIHRERIDDKLECPAPSGPISIRVGDLRISIVVPVYNDARNLGECLAALRVAATGDAEIIVVDDGSTDDSVVVAERAGIRLVQLPRNSGPAAARNRGAASARGEILLFVDSDVAVAPDAVLRVLTTLGRHRDVAAVFGSYDARPRAPGVISQYRNLLHHFVHQHGHREAFTFWTGCGAVRRGPFAELGGFDERGFCRAIEDIELGYRLRRAGYRILLDKDLLGTHLKAWTFASLLRTDILQRAIPWSRLIIAGGAPPNDLNLKTGQRVAAGLALLALACLALTPFRRAFVAPAVGALLGVIALNRDLYGFFLRQRGARFTAAAFLLHLLYLVYSSLSYLAVWLAAQARRRFHRGSS